MKNTRVILIILGIVIISTAATWVKYYSLQKKYAALLQKAYFGQSEGTRVLLEHRVINDAYIPTVFKFPDSIMIIDSTGNRKLLSSVLSGSDEATHVQALAIVGKRHLAAIDLAVLGVENFAAGPGIALLLQSPQDGHADDRFVLALVLALLAQVRRIVTGLIEDLFHNTLELAVFLGDPDCRPLLFGLVIDAAPDPDRRTASRGEIRHRYQRNRKKQASHRIHFAFLLVTLETPACRTAVGATRNLSIAFQFHSIPRPGVSYGYA